MPTPRFLLALALGASPVGAQQLAKPPSDSVLTAITARGRTLAEYDIAIRNGGNAIMALKPAPGEITTSLAIHNADGTWSVGAGRLSAKKGSFYTTYSAVQTGRDSTFNASRYHIVPANTGYVREMALAFETAKHQFGAITRPFNTYVIPAPGGGLWVYILPAQTTSTSFPLGDDVRYHIVGGTTIVDSVRFHRTILERQTGFKPDGSQQVASLHSSSDSLPSETDVFVVLRQSPHLPEVVLTRNFSYEIQVDGSIRWKRMGELPKVVIDPADLAAHIPVWKAKIDTVGSAPRIMSPGYTEWRDTTTGWRMSFEQMTPIRITDSVSLNRAYRTLTLNDGRVLVTRIVPARGIQLYDADGKFVREIGRVGSGPGEFSWSPQLAVKGDTVIAFDSNRRTMLLFTLEGRFIREFRVTLSGAPGPLGIDPRGLIRMQQEYGTGLRDTLSHVQWVYYTTTGVAVDSMRRPELLAPRAKRIVNGTSTSLLPLPFAAAIADAFLPDGTLLYGTADRYQFNVTKNGRDTVRIFGRSDMPPIPIPAARVDSIMSSLARTLPQLVGVITRNDIPANYPVWNSATVDDHGYVWVSSGLSGSASYVSIFAPDGRLLGTTPLYLERVDQLSFGGDRVSYVTLDRDGKPMLRVYKVDRRGMQ